MDPCAYHQFRELERDHFWFRGRRAVFLDVLRRALPPRSPSLLLDLGCGVGGMLGLLARFGRVVGVDRSDEALHHCRERGSGWVAGADVRSLPFPDHAFDVVALFDVLAHLGDDVAVMREVLRCTRPGGHVFLSLPAYEMLRSGNDAVVRCARRYRRSDVFRVLRAAGFEVVRVSYFNTLLFPLILPRLLLAKLRERLFGPVPGRTNLSLRLPRVVNSLFAAMFGGERFLLRWLDLPFGHSLLALARAPLVTDGGPTTTR